MKSIAQYTPPTFGPALTLLGLLLLAPCVSAQEPILHWTFDEGDGPALDSGSLPPADGILGSNALRTTNTPGGASPLALDLTAEGLQSGLDAGDVAKVDTLAQFTLSTWILLKGLNSDQPGGSNNVRLLAKQSGGAFDGFSWNLNAPNFDEVAPDNFRLGMFIGGANGFAFGQSTEDLGADDQWTFVAVTYDGLADEDNLSFYFGDEAREVATLGDPLTVLAGELNSTAGIANLAVGYTDADRTVDFALNGYQDDVRIYDQVLTRDALEAIRLANLQPQLIGDFNLNGILDQADIDLLTAESASLMNNPTYDLNGDSLVNFNDIEGWIQQLFGSWVGDADLDGEFNSSDLVVVLGAGTYETGINSVWSTGDFNGDGRTGSSDLVVALGDGGYELGPRAAVRAVPEPGGAWLLLAGWGCVAIRRRAREITG